MQLNHGGQRVRNYLPPLDLVDDLEADEVHIRGVLPLTDHITYRAPRHLACRGAHFLKTNASAQSLQQESRTMIPINRLKRWPFPSVPSPRGTPPKPMSGEQEQPKPAKNRKRDDGKQSN